jgi:hypothetical protein
VPNYGDVALGLKPSWKRSQYPKPEQTLFAVGHEEGKADVYLTKEPDAEHQFRWVNASDKEEVTGLLMKGYKFVNKDEWTKRLEYLWEWSAEGKVYYGGQLLMARPKSEWLKDEQMRASLHKEAWQNQSSDRELDNAPDGLIAEEGGKAVRRRKGI